MEKRLLVLFDGNALVHRAFHALPPLTVSKTGEMVGAVYGFILILLKAISELTQDQAWNLLYDWSFWARPEQLEPEQLGKDGKFIWLRW